MKEKAKGIARAKNHLTRSYNFRLRRLIAPCACKNLSSIGVKAYLHFYVSDVRHR